MGSLDPQTRWHPLPKYHLKAPRGWINDPCAPGYDPSTGTYHLFYQWNPKSCDWGDICWGQYTSIDGVHWQANGSSPVLEPSFPYDRKGIFTGCFYPTGPKGEKDQLTLIYSSIKDLPIHWTLPYIRNCAGLSLATSCDGGISWKKSPLNPILQGEPDGVVVTGFRDPYLAEWHSMDTLRGEKSLYGIVSGGVVGSGPDAFLYAVSPNDLTTWTYLGRLCDFPLGYQLPTHWQGDFGVNWECVNFMTLHSETGAQKEFLLMGTEGGNKRAVEEGEDPHCVWTMFMAGSLSQTKDGPRLQSEFSGMLDHGNLYAASSYLHPETNERIVWGWLKEDELTLARREAKGWTGYLSLPREVFLWERRGIKRALQTRLQDIPSLKLEEDANGTLTAQTLGIRPLANLATLRTSNPQVWTNIAESKKQGRLADISATSWEMQAVVQIKPDQQGRVGFHIHHNDDPTRRTTISFSPAMEEIRVDRILSNGEDDIGKEPQWGPFTLFVHDSAEEEVVEKLHIRVFVDGDVFEVFANDRFALSTVVYADSITCSGISWFKEDQSRDGVTFDSISIWGNLANAGRKGQSHHL